MNTEPATYTFGHDFTKEIVSFFLNAIEDGTRNALRIIWEVFISFLFDHWIAVIVTLGLVLIYAIAKALMGSWGFLGHILYNYLYFGSIFIIASIWGPEVFAGTYVDIGLFILYILCYVLVGKILNRTGLGSYR